MNNPPYTHLPDGTPLPTITFPDVSDEGEEIDCWNCEDQGWTVTVGGIRQPCPDCKTGDLFFYHERPPGAA